MKKLLLFSLAILTFAACTDVEQNQDYAFSAWIATLISVNPPIMQFSINGKLLVKKFQVPVKGGAVSKQGKKPNLSRLVEGQVHLHIDTENLRKNAHKVSPSDLISITYKIHGTSWWVSHVKVKRY